MIDPAAFLRGFTPTFFILADGKPFNISRVLKIEVTDAAGFESDELTITMDDCFPFIARPREGAKLSLSLGFLETGKVFIGTYIFEEWERNGFERTATLVAKAAEHAKTLKEPKTRAWDGKTVGGIIEKIGKEQGLKVVIPDTLKNLKIDYIAQTEESDQNLLTRLGKRFGAVIAPKDGHLVVTERHSGKTASGKDMPSIVVSPTRLVSSNAYYVRLKSRSRYSKFIANWDDRASGKAKQVTFQGAIKGPSYTLRERFQNATEALKAAEAKRNELRAGEGEMSVELIGDPKARAEAPVIVQGVAPDIDGNWISSSITHSWDFGESGGATTTVEAQYGKDEDKKKPKKKTNKTGSGEYVTILDR